MFIAGYNVKWKSRVGKEKYNTRGENLASAQEHVRSWDANSHNHTLGPSY